MTHVTELGYVGLGVKDLAAWERFAAEIVGLEVVAGETPASRFLRLDTWHHRIILEEDGTDDLSFLGLRVAGVLEFRAMHDKLRDAGIAVRMGHFEEAAARHVLEVMSLEDPSGIPLEIFHGPHVQPDKPFYPGRRMHGRFKTGDGGLGHLMMRQTAGLEATHAFYSLLGMRGSIEYRIPVPNLPRPFDLMFMHCNSRDHTIAFGAPGKKRINHLMFEFDCFDDVGLSHEIVQRNKVPVGIAPGRHANDEMYSFYFMNPSNWMIELGWGARPATHQSEYYQRDTYGHEAQSGVVNANMEPVTKAAE
ncbi:MAG: 2,3-dihydroxybiphenyl 1,2-dioxygenase [Alphaproteobacteria bacterium]|nr:2,3-dihydroxybiphenyl 1,2-dioxygenase [Alphaproteobacteria bacterium]